jgi:hypothetical protein
MIDAGIDGNSRNPMLKRHVCPILVNFGKDLKKYLLRQILFQFPPGKVVPNNPYDRRIQPFNELFRSRFVRPARSRNEL